MLLILASARLLLRYENRRQGIVRYETKKLSVSSQAI